MNSQFLDQIRGGRMTPSSEARACFLALMTAILGTGGLLGADTQVSKDTSADLRNWIEIGGGGSWIESGDSAQFLRRRQVPRDGFGGVVDFHLEEDVGKKALLTIDGRGMFDHYYRSVTVALTEENKGYLKLGYRQHWTYYDGSGGYLPSNGQWLELYDDHLELDRGSVWFEGGLRLPEVPQFTIRYEYGWRDGMKDSLIWGDTTLTTGGAARGIVPTFLSLDEHRHSVALDVNHTFGNTEVGLGLRYEKTDLDNSRNIRRSPLQASDRHLTHRELVVSDLFSTHVTMETRLSETWLFTSGYAFTTLDTDLGGSRIFGAGYEPIFDPLFGKRQARDEGFFGLTGGSQLKQYLANFNLMWTPVENLAVIPAIRVEKQDVGSDSTFTETAVGTGAGLPTSLIPLAAVSERGLLDVSAGLEARYTGVTNWVFYTRNDWMTGSGDLHETEVLLTPPVTSDLLRSTDFERFTQKYAIGANWYPSRIVSFGT